MSVPLYLLPGMNGGDRIFSRLLPLLPNCNVLEWISPHASESLVEYAGRLAERIPRRDCVIGGVSFGGMIALEISRIIRPRGCILISSVREPSQLPPWMRLARVAPALINELLLRVTADVAKTVPTRSRTGTTARLSHMAGDAGTWRRWAISAALRWQPERTATVFPVFHIHGDCDTTFPLRYVDPDVVVPHAGHLLPLTHPADVADAMLSVMAHNADAFVS